ncbi:DUF3021 domain-containing protein [bacterium 1XD21-13]|nr:DUF3021 domain-containing protein [bacterium 1XD21-13]
MNLRKKLLLRSSLGAPIGITISYCITLLISVFTGDGNYYPVVPALAESLGSEINAVLIQAICSALYGAVWGGLSIIWQFEHWSLLKMTVTHFTIASVTTLPVAYLMQWMPRSVPGMLIYFGIFFAIYFGIWFSQFCTIKKHIEELNRKVRETNASSHC